MDNINKVFFIGSKQLGLSCLRTMHYLDPRSLAGIMTFNDRLDTRSVLKEFKQFAKKNKIKFFLANNKEDSERIIGNFKPQLCIVVGWYWLISKGALSFAPDGFIGMHNSLLPKYRGGSPLIWALLNGEKEVGLSLFTLTSGMDSGDIWGQRKFKVLPNDYIGDILKKLEKQGVALLKEKYLNILNRRIKPVRQNHKNATFCAQRLPKDGNIDWENPAEKVYDFIRFQSEPYPGAFTYYQGRKLLIYKASLSGLTSRDTPGKIVKIDKDGVYVICGDNRLIILKTLRLGSSRKAGAKKIIKSTQAIFSNFLAKS